MDVSLLMPVRNEIRVIEQVIDSWIHIFEHLGVKYEIILIDGASTDGTLEFLLNLQEKSNKIKLISEEEAKGFKNSLTKLLEQAKHEWIFVADSDGQYLASDFLYFFEKSKERNIKFVKGIKINRNDSFFRRIYSLLINYFIVIYFGFPFADYNSSHYLLHSSLLNKIKGNGFNFTYLINIEIALKSILSNEKYAIVYIKHKKRLSGQSRSHPRIKIIFHGLISIFDIIKLKQNFNSNDI